MSIIRMHAMDFQPHAEGFKSGFVTLVGRPNAGKSTLMKMLFGLEQPTSGEIWVHGEKLTLSSPTVAISHGIGMVHQHFMLVPSLKCW